MSYYIKAEDILPKELLEAIQQYVDGKLIYIPSKEKLEWGSETSARSFFRERNAKIYQAHLHGASIKDLSLGFSLSEKSIQRILHDQRLAAEAAASGADRDSSENRHTN